MSIATPKPCAYCQAVDHQTYACPQAMPMVQPTEFEAHYRPRWGEVVGLTRSVEDNLRYDFSRSLELHDKALEELRTAMNDFATAQNNLADAFEGAARDMAGLYLLMESRTLVGRLKRFWAWVRRQPTPYPQVGMYPLVNKPAKTA